MLDYRVNVVVGKVLCTACHVSSVMNSMPYVQCNEQNVDESPVAVRAPWGAENAYGRKFGN